MEEKKLHQPDQNRAQEQDEPLKNSDKHGHWYGASRNGANAEPGGTAHSEERNTEHEQRSDKREQFYGIY